MENELTSITKIEDENLKFQKGKLTNEIDEIEEVNSRRKKWSFAWMVIVLGVVVVFNFPDEFKIVLGWKILLWCILIIGVLGLIANYGNISTDKKIVQQKRIELSIVEDKLFANEISELTQEERAVRQLSKSQLDLENYYQLNFSHVYKIFNLGRLLLILGNGIILLSLIVAMTKIKNIDSLLVILGFVGGIIVDFTGAIFIVMYSRTIKSANMNQYGMLETNQAYLGNVLASQIKNNELREKTLAEMANKLISKEKKINFND